MFDGKLAWIAVAVGSAFAAQPAAAVQLQTVVAQGAGLSQATYVTGAPGDDTRLYVTQKGGLVRLVRDGAVQSTPFLDLTSLVDTDSEGGLLSMAFPPDHRRSGLFYVFLVVEAPAGFTGNDVVIQEHRLDGCSPDLADPTYTREVIRVPHRQRDNHNGGQVGFGPDGNLWFSAGDGGGTYDPEDDAQRTDNGLGKIHRITPTPGGGYTIPAGNPYAGSSVWSYGLRNPWRFSFDRGTGDLWIGDVGQGGRRPASTGDTTDYENIEEIDVARAAAGREPTANYGWRRFEGNRDYGSGPAPPGYVPPVITVDGATGWDSVTGGHVVRDPALEWVGQYVFGDFGTGEIRRADAANPADNQVTPLTLAQLVSFGEDWSGRVYALSFAGRLARLVSDTGTNGPALPADPAGGCVPQPRETSAPPAIVDPVIAPGPPPVALTPPDRTRPRLLATARRRQGLRRRALALRASCDEPCRLTATARLSAGGRRYSVRALRRSLRARQAASLRLRLGPRAFRAAQRSRRPSVTVVLRAVDAAGNATRRTLRIALTS